MFFLKTILLTSILCFNGIFSYSQKLQSAETLNQFRTLHWTVDDGLAHDQTYCMLKDVNSFLWIGTSEGLSRFDGSSFKNFYYQPEKKESISGSKIFGLIEDSLHNIWIGTERGLSRYDMKADTFTNFLPTVISAAASTFIVPFFANSNEVFCRESDSIITSYNIHSFRKKILIKLNADDKIVASDYSKKYAVYDAATNSIWMLAACTQTHAGLLQISLLTKKRTYYNWHCFLEVPHYCHWSEAMCYDKRRNAIWLNSSDGLVEFTIADKKFNYIDVFKKFNLLKSYGSTPGIDIDTKGRIWFVSYPAGASIYNPEDNTAEMPFQKDPILNQELSAENGLIYCDADNIAWFGFWLRKGIYQSTPISSPAAHYLADSSANPWHNIIANFVYAGNGKLWIGTDEDGIIVFDTRNNSFISMPLQNIQSIKTHPSIEPLFIDTVKQKAVLQIETYNGLYVMDMKSKKCDAVNFKNNADENMNINRIGDVRSFQNNCLVSAASNGKTSFFQLNLNNETAHEFFSLPENIAAGNFATDGIKYLFIKRLQSAGNSTYYFSNSKWNVVATALDSINWSKIVYSNNDNSYWVQTPAALMHYNAHFNLLKKYTVDDGLPQNEIFILLPDDSGNVWFNTNRYIYRLNVKTAAITALSEKDGFVHQDFRGDGEGGLKYNGKLYFPGHGTAQGFVEINPDKYVSSPSLAYFKSISIKQFSFPDSISINRIDNLHLKYFQNRIVVQTGTIDYYSDKKGKIRYKLSDVNENWQYAPAEYTIRYEELPPGKYTLMVQAGNAGNEFSGPVKYLSFNIAAAWWNTWLFRICAAIFILVISYAIAHYRSKQKFRLRLENSEKEKEIADINQKAAELQQQKMELEMQALRAQMNPHFIFNSLNSINRFILQSNKLQASEYLTKFSRLIRLILQNSQASFIPLETELDALKLYLELEAVRFDHQFEYKIIVDEEIDIAMIKIPPLVIQPYAENAIWHGLMHKKEKGLLEIDLTLNDQMLFCKITDNGVGRKKAEELGSKSAASHKSMGLRITADRIARLQRNQVWINFVTVNDLEYPDRSPAGTQVILKIPIMND